MEKPQLLIGVMIDEPRGAYYGGATAAPVFKRIAERSLQILDRLPKGTVVRALAKAPATLPKGDPATIPEIRVAPDGVQYMPNLKGLSMREALKVLGEHVPSIKMAGDGF